MTTTTNNPIENGNDITIHPDSLEALRLLVTSDPIVAKKFCSGLPKKVIIVDDDNTTTTTNNNNNTTTNIDNDDTKVSYWIKGSTNAIQFDMEGKIIQLDFGGTGKRIKNLPMDAFKKIKNSLKILNLGGTDLPLNQMIPILKDLLCCNTTTTNLEKLYLGGNGLNDNGIEQIVHDVFLEGGCTNTSSSSSKSKLQLLDLRYNDIGSNGIKALSIALMDSFILKSSLLKLYLEGNCITNDGIQYLSNVLKYTTIQELYLGSNQIGSDGAISLANYLESTNTTTYPSISKLYLEGNNIGYIGATAFTNVLTKLNGNVSLKQLFVDNNNIGKDGSKALAKALNSSTAIGDAL